MKTLLGRRLLMAASAVLVLAAFGTPSQADPLRVGKPQGEVFSFVPLDVGIQQGIFTKHGIEVESLNLGGAAKLRRPWRRRRSISASVPARR